MSDVRKELEADAEVAAAGKIIALAAEYLAASRDRGNHVSSVQDQALLANRFDEPMPRGVAPLEAVIERLRRDVIPDSNWLHHPRAMGHQVAPPLPALVWTESVIAALNNFFDPIQQLSQLYTTYQAGMAALDKIFELLDEEPDLRDRPDAIELPRLRGELAFEGVSFAYSADGDKALDGIDLHVPAGQTVALVGSTGAGKSTFAKLAARFYDPTEGRVLVDGLDLRQVDLAAYRHQLGIVPQEPFLFSGTLAENIAYGRPEATRAEVEAAARTTGADELVESLPGGYDHVLGERGRSLSAGQRQLVALARGQ